MKLFITCFLFLNQALVFAQNNHFKKNEFSLGAHISYNLNNPINTNGIGVQMQFEKPVLWNNKFGINCKIIGSTYFSGKPTEAYIMSNQHKYDFQNAIIYTIGANYIINKNWITRLNAGLFKSDNALFKSFVLQPSVGFRFGKHLEANVTHNLVLHEIGKGSTLNLALQIIF